MVYITIYVYINTYICVFAADFGIHTHDLNLPFHHIIKALTVEPSELIDETIVMWFDVLLWAAVTEW